MCSGILSMMDTQYATASAFVHTVLSVALLKSDRTLRTPRGVVIRWKKIFVWSEWYLRNLSERSFQRSSVESGKATFAAITPVHSTATAATAQSPSLPLTMTLPSLLVCGVAAYAAYSGV